jgi:hypothetical protein
LARRNRNQFRCCAPKGLVPLPLDAIQNPIHSAGFALAKTPSYPLTLAENPFKLG